MKNIENEYEMLNKCAISEQRDQVARVMNKLNDEWMRILDFYR